METDWFVDDRFGPFKLVWSPRQENGEHNPHVVVAGKSGAGKSTLLYHLILWLLANGCGVTVIDMTGQYVKYARWLRTSDSRELHGALNLDGDRARVNLFPAFASSGLRDRIDQCWMPCDRGLHADGPRPRDRGELLQA
jgi:hypothetical protein